METAFLFASANPHEIVQDNEKSTDSENSSSLFAHRRRQYAHRCDRQWRFVDTPSRACRAEKKQEGEWVERVMEGRMEGGRGWDVYHAHTHTHTHARARVRANWSEIRDSRNNSTPALRHERSLRADARPSTTIHYGWRCFEECAAGQPSARPPCCGAAAPLRRRGGGGGSGNRRSDAGKSGFAWHPGRVSTIIYYPPLTSNDSPCDGCFRCCCFCCCCFCCCCCCLRRCRRCCCCRWWWTAPQAAYRRPSQRVRRCRRTEPQTDIALWTLFAATSIAASERATDYISFVFSSSSSGGSSSNSSIRQTPASAATTTAAGAEEARTTRRMGLRQWRCKKERRWHVSDIRFESLKISHNYHWYPGPMLCVLVYLWTIAPKRDYSRQRNVNKKYQHTLTSLFTVSRMALMDSTKPGRNSVEVLSGRWASHSSLSCLIRHGSFIFVIASSSNPECHHHRLLL